MPWRVSPSRDGGRGGDGEHQQNRPVAWEPGGLPHNQATMSSVASRAGSSPGRSVVCQRRLVEIEISRTTISVARAIAKSSPDKLSRFLGPRGWRRWHKGSSRIHWPIKSWTLTPPRTLVRPEFLGRHSYLAGMPSLPTSQTVRAYDVAASGLRSTCLIRPSLTLGRSRTWCHTGVALGNMAQPYGRRPPRSAPMRACRWLRGGARQPAGPTPRRPTAGASGD